MRFVCLVEHNNESEHTNMVFLQYDQNQEMINKLKNLIHYADFSNNVFGEYSEFELELNFFDESTVRQMVMLDSEFINISVCCGFLDFPEEDFLNLDEYDTALKLDELLHNNQIEKYYV